MGDVARKSRKPGRGKADEKAAAPAVFFVGFYVRVSNEEGQGESAENQKKLLEEFARGRPELRWAATFVDEGKTGKE